jgi:hypothetical protein
MASFIFGLPIPLRVFRWKNAVFISPNSDSTRFYSFATGYKRLASPVCPTAFLLQQKPAFPDSFFKSPYFWSAKEI